MKNILFCMVVLLTSCNPFPKKDAHPEVPFLEDLLKDETKFKKIIGPENISEIIFLKDDKILLKPSNSELSFKIIDANKTVYFDQVADWKKPFYIDKAGNIYLNKQKYFYPDYKKHEDFKTVVFKDSLDKKSEQLGTKYPDSIKFKMLDEFEISLLKTYHLTPCEYTVVHQERCNIFEIRNNTLVVRQTELFKNDFSKLPTAIPKFDDDVLIRWENGKMVTPIYLAYHQLNTYQFKCDDMMMPTTINLNGKQYLFTHQFGLYLIKE